MSTFWNSDDKIPVKQTKISIPAENGLNYSAGQLINITIPSNVRFIQPKETYLKLDVLINGGGAGNRLMLDAELGGQVLIRDIRVYSGGAGGQLLEEIQNYNVLTALRYDYHQSESIRNKRCLTEGCNDFNPETRGTFCSLKSSLNNVNKNAYSRAYTDDNETNSQLFGTATSNPVGTDRGLQKVKCLLPLHTGIFQNDRVFPALLTEGLRIEILLESASRCLRQLDTTSAYNRIGSSVYFHSCGNLATEGGIDTDINGQRWGVSNMQEVNYIWFRRDNQCISAENFPLVVGEYFDLINAKYDPVTDTTSTARCGYVGGSTLYNGKNATPVPSATAPGLLRVSQIKFFAGDGDPDTQGGRYGLVRVKLEAPAYLPGASASEVSGVIAEWVAVSKEIAIRNKTGTDGVLGGNLPVFNPNYTLSDVELIIQELEMPQGYVNKLMGMMKQNGTLNYDFLSHTNYKYSQLKNDIVANIRLPLNQTRAKAILSICTDASIYSNVAQVSGSDRDWGGGSGAQGGGNSELTYPVFDVDKYTYQLKNVLQKDAGLLTTGTTQNGTAVMCWDHLNSSVRTGLTGIWDNIKDYQWFYNGKLNPSRLIDCTEVASGQSLSQQWCIEAEKSLSMSGIPPLSFRKLHENAFIGRALALQNGVYNTVGHDFNLQINYSANGEKNHLWHNFVSHIRRLTIRGNQIALEI
tara:strand:+ start:8377 stop:10458 length:2082 start_codon:yes stop_codon:yes gene_type:complete